MDPSYHFGEFLRELRDGKCWTQQDLRNEIWNDYTKEVSVRTIRRAEEGQSIRVYNLMLILGSLLDIQEEHLEGFFADLLALGVDPARIRLKGRENE